MNQAPLTLSDPILPHEHAIAAGEPPITGLTPARLADLLLVGPLSLRASTALLEPDSRTATVTLLRGTAPVAELRVGADVANAAATRLAKMAGLDPLVEAHSLDGNANVRRLLVRAGRERVEALVSVGASARGLQAEVRILSQDGRIPDVRSPGQLARCPRCGGLQQRGPVSTCERDGGPMIEIEDSAVQGGTVGVYRLGSHLGEGASGTVFAAEHAVLGRQVAIKILDHILADDPEMAHRFLGEARATCRLKHRSVLEVTDFGILPDGRPYMVMEHLQGEPLSDLLDRRSALPPAAALLLAREMALALGAAHEAGLAHNDLKPANVMVLEGSTDEAPRIKVIDFGCATLFGSVEAGLFGTPGYMAPERITGNPSDGRADVYAVGIILYEMIAGAAPREAPSLPGLLLAQAVGPLPRLTSPTGALPAAVHRLVSRATAVKMEERHQSAAELVADVDHALAAVSREGSWRWCP